MQIKQIEVGYLKTNCYILIKNNKCIIIDPGDESEKIIKTIGSIKPIAIIITHDHFDHVGAKDKLKEYYNIPSYDMTSLEEKHYIIEEFEFEIIYTKGHADTCITIYFEKEKIMFTGDFLFKDNIGRTDLKTSNQYEMEKSLSKIKKYPNDVIIYPGHGQITNLGYEKENNYYLKKVI